MGTKRSILTDEKGLPLSVVLSGANTHDIKLLEQTPLEGIVIFRSEPSATQPQHLCLDAGYTGSKEMVEGKGYTANIRSRGDEKKEIEHNPAFKARRWVVEVTHFFFNRFRKLLVRFEKKADNYLSLIHFACAVIVWRKIIRVRTCIITNLWIGSYKAIGVRGLSMFHGTSTSVAGKIRRAMVFLLFCALVFSSGCGQRQSVSPSRQSSNQDSRKIQLKVLYSGENVNWVAAIENLGDVFMREHPNIDLKLGNTGVDNYTEALKVKEATDEFPDILEIQDPYMFQRAGKLGEMPSSVSSLVEHPVAINGKIYAIPLYFTTEGIIYNQVLFQRYHLSKPKTYQEFISLCTKLKSSGVTPLAVGGTNSKSLNCWFDYFFRTDVIADIPNWQEKRNQKAVSFRDPRPVQMIQDYKTLMASPYVLEDSINMNDNQLVSKLIDSQFAMMYAEPSLLPQIIDAYPEAAEPEQGNASQDSRIKCRVGWFFMPDRDGNPVAVNRCGAQWAISGDCAKNEGKEKATAQFFEFFFSTDCYRKVLQVMYAVPSTKAAILYPAAGVQQKLLVSYRYAAKSETYFGNNETPEWFIQSLEGVLKYAAMNTSNVKSVCEKLDAIWDHAGR